MWFAHEHPHKYAYLCHLETVISISLLPISYILTVSYFHVFSSLLVDFNVACDHVMLGIIIVMCLAICVHVVLVFLYHRSCSKIIA